jgi:hypothetical protein
MNRVERLWPGETVVCLASGPSLTQEDCDYVRGKARVIAVNRTIDRAPWADALYCADAKMWKWLDGAPQFGGLKFGAQDKYGRFAVAKWGVTVLTPERREGLSLDPTRLVSGQNSGYQAINLAVLLGASRIVLLGYDMQTGPKGEQHWHEDHPQSNAPEYSNWAQRFATLVEPLAEAGIEVVNCTARTALTCFPCRPLRDALLHASEVAA